jgi:hypothetical protein
MTSASESRTPGQAPAWARMLGDDGFQAFIARVEHYFSERNIEITLNTAEGIIAPDYEVLSRRGVFGLQNIAQKCSHAERERWDKLIAEHFDCLFEPNDAENVLSVDMRSLNAVQGRIRSRLYPEAILKQTSAIVHRTVADDLLEVLVLDLPKSVRTVSRNEADRWPLTDDELFMLGRRNLSRDTSLRDTRVPLPGSVLHMFSGDNFYGASHLLVFERYLTQALPHGMVVSVPKRDVIIGHYIRNIGVLEAISGMLQVTAGMYDEGPGSLSPNLYWYRNSSLTLLPYEARNGGFGFHPPAEFEELLQALSAHAQLS